MNRALRFSYELWGAGWATAMISLGAESVDMPVSCLHDSLRELAVAIETLDKGASHVSVMFLAEPGEHHLRFDRVDPETVEIEVVCYYDWTYWGFTEPGEPSLRGRARFAELREQVVSALAAVLARHGVQGYLKQWINHSFPIAEYERLVATTPPT